LRLDQEDVRHTIAASLLLFTIILTSYLWFIDLLHTQKTFGALLAADLVAFAMLVHLYLKENALEVSRSWLLSGCISLAVLLVYAL
jgi:hypothetical protein